MYDAAIQKTVGQMAATIYAQGRHTQEAAVRAAGEIFTLVHDQIEDAHAREVK
jgi:hypothetical protein